MSPLTPQTFGLASSAQWSSADRPPATPPGRGLPTLDLLRGPPGPPHRGPPAPPTQPPQLKAGGYWGGSAHYPDPTAQSVALEPAPSRTRAARGLPPHPPQPPPAAAVAYVPPGLWPSPWPSGRVHMRWSSAHPRCAETTPPRPPLSPPTRVSSDRYSLGHGWLAIVASMVMRSIVIVSDA